MSLHLLVFLFAVAAEKMVGEDYWGAMVEFESILAEYPLDPYSLHMAYFLALTIGRQIPTIIQSGLRSRTFFDPDPENVHRIRFRILPWLCKVV